MTFKQGGSGSFNLRLVSYQNTWHKTIYLGYTNKRWGVRQKEDDLPFRGSKRIVFYVHIPNLYSRSLLW